MSSARHAQTVDAEVLLAHSAWFARLARALAAEGDAIDAVVAEPFATAHDCAASKSETLRRWLGALAHEVLPIGGRGDPLRVIRDLAAPVPWRLARPQDVLDRAELRLAVIDLVLSLEEPLRSAVVLHFCEERDVVSIARLTSVSEEVVRVRIRSGVERVRERLVARTKEQSRGAVRGSGLSARARLRSPRPDRWEEDRI